MRTLLEWQFDILHKKKMVNDSTELLLEYGDGDFENDPCMEVYRKAKADLLLTYENAFNDIFIHPVQLPSLNIVVKYTHETMNMDGDYRIAEIDPPEWAISDEVANTMVQYFIEQLTPFGIDWSGFTTAEFTLESDYLGELVFINANNYEIHVSRIWYNHENGNVMQYGAQHGNLTI